MSSGKNPSAKRFHPRRASFTWLEFTTLTYEIETSWTRVGVCVLKPGKKPAAPTGRRGSSASCLQNSSARSAVVGVEVLINLGNHAVHPVEEPGGSGNVIGGAARRVAGSARNIRSRPRIQRQQGRYSQGLPCPPPETMLASVAAITAGSGTQLVPAWAPFSRCPS